MRLIRITPPPTSPVSLQDAKDHLRIEHSDDDTLIDHYLQAAVQRLDGRDGFLGRALITQTWKLLLDGFPDAITVPLPPCQAVAEIAYVDAAGTVQTLAADAYQVFGLADAAPAGIVPAFGTAWPATRAMREAVSVTFRAGYGDSAADVPAPLRTAILQFAGTLYANRETVTADAVDELPDGALATLAEHRVWAF
ncbi:MAG: hypothetical protein HC900_03295 [Methylacidiphilales bacterium]|nr:hypothetical protein [Candidatus Methylacidiphilales bacterium]